MLEDEDREEGAKTGEEGTSVKTFPTAPELSVTPAGGTFELEKETSPLSQIVPVDIPPWRTPLSARLVNFRAWRLGNNEA